METQYREENLQTTLGLTSPASRHLWDKIKDDERERNRTIKFLQYGFDVLRSLTGVKKAPLVSKLFCDHAMAICRCEYRSYVENILRTERKIVLRDIANNEEAL